MPKLYLYFGLRIYFYANEHEPVHVHGFYQGRESKAEIVIENGVIVGIRILRVGGMKPLTGRALADSSFCYRSARKISSKSGLNSLFTTGRLKRKLSRGD